jgi:hypothetical protein
LNNPNNSDQQAKNFKCDGKALPVEKLPKIVKFRILDPANATQKNLIDMVKAQSIVKITPELIAGVGVAGTSAPRAFREGIGTNAYNEGDVLMLQQLDALNNVLKIGFIDVVRVQFRTPDNESTLTFNCYYQK